MYDRVRLFMIEIEAEPRTFNIVGQFQFPFAVTNNFIMVIGHSIINFHQK